MTKSTISSKISLNILIRMIENLSILKFVKKKPFQHTFGYVQKKRTKTLNILFNVFAPLPAL